MHTINDMDMVRTTVAAVIPQSRPVISLLIFDNTSSDGAPDVDFPPITPIGRNSVHVSTSGAEVQGLAYGLENSFDWIWMLDADIAPRPDVLQILLYFHASLTREAQLRTAWITSLPANDHDGEVRTGLHLAPSHVVEAPCEPDAQWYRFDCTIWSGTLSQMASALEIRLPPSQTTFSILSKLNTATAAGRPASTPTVTRRALSTETFAGRRAACF